MERLKNWLIISLFGVIGLLLMLRQCGPSNPEKVSYIKGKDSVVYRFIPRPYKVVEFEKVPYPKWDTAYIDTNKSLPNIDPNIVRVYNDSTIDDSISIYHNIKVLGMIQEQKFSYRLKTPLATIKETYRTDTLIKSPKFSIYTGMGVEGNSSSLNLSPFIGVNYKRAYVGYEYGILNKTHGIKVGIKLFSSKR